MGRHRAQAGRDLPGARVSLRIPGSPMLRVLAVLAAAATVAGLLWWRGPDWHTVWHAFDAVKWYWVAGAIGLNLLSVVMRAFAWRTVINQAIEPPHPRFMLVFSAFSVGLFANAVLPGRIGELARVAVMTRKLRLQGREEGIWAALVGTVFAHRLFDLVPTVAADPLRGRHGEDPALGDREHRGRRRRRLRPVRVRVRERAASQPVGARGARPGAAPARDGPARPRRPARARARRRSRRSSRRSAGSASCSRSTSRCGPSTSTRRCRRPRSCCC